MKSSKQNTNRDVICRYLVSSDPKISSLRKRADIVESELLPENKGVFRISARGGGEMKIWRKAPVIIVARSAKKFLDFAPP